MIKCKECKFDNNGWCKFHKAQGNSVENCIFKGDSIYRIATTQGITGFVGHYRPDLQTDNWHYYMELVTHMDGTKSYNLRGIRKEHFVTYTVIRN